MHGFWVLFQSMLRHYFGLSVLRERLRTKQQLIGIFGSALGVLVVGAFFVYGYNYFILSIYTASVQLQQSGLIVLFGLLAVQLIALFLGFFYVLSVFYYSPDMEFLVPLPLQPRTILTAKLGIVLLTEYATALPLALPPIIIYGVHQGLGLLFWLKAAVVVALLPLLPLALAGTFAIVLMRFTNLARHRDALRVISGLVSVFVAIWLQYNVSRLDAVNDDLNLLMADIIAVPNSLIQMLGNRFPPSMWGAMALTNSGNSAFGYLLVYVGAAIAAFALLVLVGQRFFYTGLLAGNSHPSLRQGRKRTMKVSIAVRKPLTALITREWQNVSRNPIFAMTAGMNLLLPPVLVVLPLLGAGDQLVNIKLLMSHPQFLTFGSLGVAGLFAALVPLSSIPATAVSREGKQFWISQIIPVAPATQAGAKLIFSVLITLLSGLLLLMVAVIFLGLPWSVVGLGSLLGIPALLLSSALSLTADYLWPRFDWANPQQAMKGNHNTLLALLLVGATIFGIVRLLIWIATLGWSHTALLVFMFALLVALSALAIRILVILANRLYAPKAINKGRSLLNTLSGISGNKMRTAVYTLLMIAVVGVIGWDLYQGQTLDYTITTDAVVIGSTTIPYSEITEVRYLAQIPSLSNRVGTSRGNYRSGTFTVAGIGRGKVFATDATLPAVAIFTADTFYIITPDEAFVFYESVQQMVDAVQRLQ